MERKTKTIILFALIIVMIMAICSCAGGTGEAKALYSSVGKTVKVLSEKIHGSGQASISFDAEKDADINSNVKKIHKYFFINILVFFAVKPSDKV